MRFFESVGQDFRVAVRSLAKSRGFTLITVSTLALGIGSAAAVFGLFNQLILRPLPGVVDGESAAFLTFDTPTSDRTNRGISTFEFDEVREQTRLIEGLASHRLYGGIASVGNGPPVQILGSIVYGDFFEVLGTAPASGRLLSAQDNALGANPTATVISERLAAILFPETVDPVGRSLSLDGVSFTIIGVTGEGFAGHERSDRIYDVWLPYPALVPLNGLSSDADLREDTPNHAGFLIRRGPGVALEAVDAQLRSVLAAMAPTSSRELDEFVPRLSPGLNVTPLARERTNASLRVMAAAALLLLLAACANAANLLLARNLARRANVAVRRAVGASSGHVARLIFTESVLLGLAGASCGAAVAWLITFVFRGQNLDRLPTLAGLTVDWRVLAFLGAAGLGTTVVFGVAPAILAGRSDLRSGMESRSGYAPRESRTRSVLAAAQIGLTLAILVGALLMERTLGHLYALETGVNVDQVASVRLNRPRNLDSDEGFDRQQRLVAAVRRVPGVDDVASAAYGPHQVSVVLGGLSGPADPVGDGFVTLWTVTEGWLELIELEPVSGDPARVFERTAGSPWNAVLTASLARRLFGGADPLGQVLGFGPEFEIRIVGVVEDYRSHQSPEAPMDVLVMDYAQWPGGFVGMSLLVKANEFTPEMTSAIRSAAASTFPELPIPDLVSYDDEITNIHAEPRALRNLFAILSGFAIAISAIGLYGVISYSVASRTREFGLRSALGAGRSTLAALTFAHGAKIVLGGAILGVGLGYAMSRVLEARLFAVEPLDVASFALAVTLIFAVGAFATWLPARRAATIDPAVALRVE